MSHNIIVRSHAPASLVSPQVWDQVLVGKCTPKTNPRITYLNRRDLKVRQLTDQIVTYR